MLDMMPYINKKQWHLSKWSDASGMPWATVSPSDERHPDKRHGATHTSPSCAAATSQHPSADKSLITTEHRV